MLVTHFFGISVSHVFGNSASRYDSILTSLGSHFLTHCLSCLRWDMLSRPVEGRTSASLCWLLKSEKKPTVPILYIAYVQMNLLTGAIWEPKTQANLSLCKQFLSISQHDIIFKTISYGNCGIRFSSHCCLSIKYYRFIFQGWQFWREAITNFKYLLRLLVHTQWRDKMTGLKNIIRSMKGNRSLYSSLLLQTVIIMIFISTISAQQFQLRNNSTAENGNRKANKNIVTTYEECKVRRLWEKSK